MLDLFLIFTALSAYTAILVALGYVVGRVHAQYHVTYRVVRRQLRKREAAAVKQEAQATALLKQLNEAKSTTVKARQELERDLERARAEMARAKGLVA